MRAKPQWCYDNCAGSRIGQGFAKDSGDPERATVAMVLEMAREDDVAKGEAATQTFMLNRLLQNAGLPRETVLICNVLRCRFGTGDYPKGALRKTCESRCRHWDSQSLSLFRPTLWSVMHDPFKIPQVPQTEEYVVAHLDAMREFVEAGERPVILAGTKALEHFAPWLQGGTRTWKRHWWKAEVPGAVTPKSTTWGTVLSSPS